MKKNQYRILLLTLCLLFALLIATLLWLWHKETLEIFPTIDKSPIIVFLSTRIGYLLALFLLLGAEITVLLMLIRGKRKP
ncbi:MAG: hypothetical protein IJW46_07805 [Clostridia bacterium]|nr:hypothetical protein [Clostridia bacterium]